MEKIKFDRINDLTICENHPPPHSSMVGGIESKSEVDVIGQQNLKSHLTQALYNEECPESTKVEFFV